MTGTNPGAWPDDWHGDVDDGKRKAFAELDRTIPLYTAADLAKAREEGRREGQKRMLADVQRWWRCACETHPVRSQREMNRHQFFMTALNELQYPNNPLGAKEAGE